MNASMLSTRLLLGKGEAMKSHDTGKGALDCPDMFEVDKDHPNFPIVCSARKVEGDN